MGFFNKDREFSHLKNLISVAMADGHLDGGEMEYLLSLAEKLKMTKEDIRKISEDPDSVRFKPPATSEKKTEQLYELVRMMMMDGEINENEFKICKDLASRLNLHPVIIEDLIKSILENSKMNIPKTKILAELSELAARKN